MVQTRSQTGNITIKKEEEEEDCKPTLVLQSVRITPRIITKRRRSKRNSRNLPAQEVKVEDDTDAKSLLKSTPKYSKLPLGQPISQEQINQLIDYVVNHGMSVTKAAQKANIASSTAQSYYNEYKNDPEKKIPLPRHQRALSKRFPTQEQVDNVIRYIVDDKMSISKASAKANMASDSGRRYYKKYLKDPDHSIPIPLYQHHTQDQKNGLIGYIVNDKMSIKAAARKAKMGVDTCYRHYHKYFGDQNRKTTIPSHVAVPKRYTQKQIKDVISYIDNDKMTIRAASRKANMGTTAASRYYQQYINSPNNEVPTPGHKAPRRHYTQEQIKEVISYIVDDKMFISAACRKANIAKGTVVKHYQQYFKDQNMEVPVSKFRNRYTQDQIDELNRCIVNDKMTKLDAAKKLNIPYSAGKRHGRQYVKNQKRGTQIK